MMDRVFPVLCSERERRDGDRDFHRREDSEDKTLGDWRRKEEGGGRDRRGLRLYTVEDIVHIDN